MPKKRHLRRLLQLILFLLATGVVSGGALVFRHGKHLASPPRRALQDYHHEYLQNDHLHGIKIQKLTCLDGKVPTLIVSPDAEAALGKRGQLIREQFSSQPVAHGQIIGTVVLLHGRSGSKEDLLPVAERFCAIGLRCLIPDLPAHGESPIQASKFGLDEWEQQMPKRVLNECVQHFHFDPQPCALWGISMGGSFATSAASEDGYNWSSLTVVSSFDRLDSVIENQCHSDALTGIVSAISQQNGGPKLSDVRPEVWAKKTSLPVLVAHGTDDTLIGLEAGKTLFSSFPSNNKRWVEVEGGTHSGVLTTSMPLYALMADWILQNLSDDQTAE